MHGRTVHWLAFSLAAAVVFGATGMAGAQDAILMDPGYAMATSQTGATNQLVSTSSYTNSLEARVAALETSLADEEIVGGWEDVSNEGLSFRVGAMAHIDTNLFSRQDAGSTLVLDDLQNYLEARALRLYIAGEGYGIYDYKLEMDFNGHDILSHVDNGVDVKDAYVGIKEIPFLGYVRAGHFREVTSLEAQTHENFTTFMERALPILAFHPDRQFGVASYNHTADEQFTMSSGLFIPNVSEDARYAADNELGLDGSTRVTWNPWNTAEGRGILHIGGGYNFIDFRNDTGTFGVRPEINKLPGQFAGVTTERLALSSGALAADWATVLNLETALVYGDFSIQSELFITSTKGVNGGLDSDFYGAYVQASYFLTGEHRPYIRTRGAFGRIVPFTNFFCVRTVDGNINTGMGAWEVAARWSFLEMEDNLNPAAFQLGGKMNDLTLGVNWYLNPNTRVMFNYIHSAADWIGPGGILPATNGETDIFATRVQFDF